MTNIFSFLLPGLFIASELDKFETRLKNMNDILYSIKKGEIYMSVQLDKLTAEVEEIGTVVDSAVELITNLATQILNLKDDPAALEALAAELDAKAAVLAEAISVNTVAEDEVDE